MKTSDFDYTLPPEKIAQTPVEPRHASRLLVLERSTGKIEHAHFREIGSYLDPGDLLVVNQTRVIPARMYALKAPEEKLKFYCSTKPGRPPGRYWLGEKGWMPGNASRS